MRSSRRSGVAHADIEIAVGREDDAVDRTRLETGLRQAVGRVQAVGAGRATAGPKFFDGAHDLAFPTAGRGLQHHARLAGIGDDGDPILRPHLLDQETKRALEERQLVGARHRAGGVDEKDEIGRQPLGGLDLVALDADAQKLAALVPGRGEQSEIDGERIVRALRPGIGVVEIIDHLLDSHRIDGRQHALLQETPDIGVGCGVDVDRQGRDRIFAHQLHRIGIDLFVPLAVRRRKW